MTYQSKPRPLLAPAPRLYGVKLLNRDGSPRRAWQGLFVRSNPCPAPDGRDTPWSADIVEAARKAAEMNAYYDDKPDLAERPSRPFYAVAPIWSAPVVVEGPRTRRIGAIRNEVQPAVSLACSYWPNDGRDDCSPRELIRSAFRFLRVRLNRGDCLQQACGELMSDAYRYADM